MPPLSIEFWIGTAIALVLFVLGLAVTLAMDAKTKGEFRFAVTCFVVSAGVIIYGIGAWQMSTSWPARSRLIITYALYACVLVLTGEAIRWAHGRHLRAEGPPPSQVVPPSETPKQPPSKTEPNPSGKSPSASSPASHSAPPGFISFVGQVINGMGPL
jgi:hypothetical protein